MADEPILNQRDILARDTFTIAERYVYLLLMVSATATFWVGDPRSKWILGGLLIAGGLSIVLLKTHELTHIYHVELLWSKFWLLSAPAWLLLLQYCLGLLQNPISPIEIEGQIWLALEPGSSLLPTSTSRGLTILSIFGYGALYLISLTLFIIPKSRAFFEKTLPWLCLSAAVLGIYGFMQHSLEPTKPLFTNGTGQNDFFAFFPYDGHWAAFAILWSSACISMSLSTTLLQESKHYLHSRGPWYLAAGSLLGLSGYWIQAHWPSIILLINYAGLLFFVTFHFATRSKDKDRLLIAITSGAFGLITFVSGIYKIFQPHPFTETASQLRRAGWEMFLDRPIFGWGLDAFNKLAPYYVHDDLLPGRYMRANSDVIQLLLEFGIVGTAIGGGLIIYLLTRYIRGRHEFHLTNYLLFGCTSILLLATLDSPFMSPAVFFSFWILFFSALRWADLSRNRVDEVDARVIVVSDAKERNVPIYTGPYKDSHK